MRYLVSLSAALAVSACTSISGSIPRWCRICLWPRRPSLGSSASTSPTPTRSRSRIRAGRCGPRWWSPSRVRPPRGGSSSTNIGWTTRRGHRSCEGTSSSSAAPSCWFKGAIASRFAPGSPGTTARWIPPRRCSRWWWTPSLPSSTCSFCNVSCKPASAPWMS